MNVEVTVGPTIIGDKMTTKEGKRDMSKFLNC